MLWRLVPSVSSLLCRRSRRWPATVRSVHVGVVPHVAGVRFAVLSEKSHSRIRCEHLWRRTDEWVDFAWSSQGPVVWP